MLMINGASNGCNRLGLHQRELKFQEAWLMKKCKKNWKQCLKKTSLTLLLVPISNGDTFGGSVLDHQILVFRSYDSHFLSLKRKDRYYLVPSPNVHLNYTGAECGTSNTRRFSWMERNYGFLGLQNDSSYWSQSFFFSHVISYMWWSKCAYLFLRLLLKWQLLDLAFQRMHSLLLWSWWGPLLLLGD